MDKIYNRHMVAKVSGCSISTVARVIMALEILAARANIDIGDMIPQGMASSLPPTDQVIELVERNFTDVRKSLSILIDEDGDAGQIRLVRDTRSLMYSGHDDAAKEAEASIGKRGRSRSRAHS